MSQLIEVTVPDIGDYTDVPVIDICVIVGDVVKVDDALVTLESDKATMDVPSSAAGVIREIRVALGERISAGAIVVVLEASEQAAATPVAAAPLAAPVAAPAPAVAAAVPVAVPAGGAVEVKVPDIGDYHDVPVIDVCVKVGDTVKVDDALVTLESDKATMDVPSSVAGVVREIRVKLGDKVSEGAVVVVVDSGGGSLLSLPLFPLPPRRSRRSRRNRWSPVFRCRRCQLRRRVLAWPPAPGRMPARRCACWPANSASISTRSRPADQKAASSRKTSRLTSRVS
jgi:pyruvate dehydrogenase E2 component (dihydrolipoamide acetyltransferase)